MRMIEGGASAEPGWLHASILWAAGLAQRDLPVWNTLFAVTQIAIGLGLLHRRTVRPALAASIGWSIVVWWFGEALGGVLGGAAQPLTGAPGAVILYALVAALAWPGPRATGLVGARGARLIWAGLWLAMAWLWLAPSGIGADSTAGALTSVTSGIGPLDALAHALGRVLAGDGLAIGISMATASAAIGVAVLTGPRPKLFLAAGAALNVIYWVLGQGLGGILAGDATDPNTGPLFCLLALAIAPALRERPPRAWGPLPEMTAGEVAAT